MQFQSRERWVGQDSLNQRWRRNGDGMRHIEPRHPDRVIENIRLVRQDGYTNFIHAEGSARLICGSRINPQNVMSGRESLEQETSSTVCSRLLAVHLQSHMLKRPATQLQHLP